MTKGQRNLLKLYSGSSEFERESGMLYYPRQRARMNSRACASHLPISTITGAFAALSPNNGEKTNSIALDICIKIASGELPESAKVPSYPINKEKALGILRGADPLVILGGRKVRAFYFNTIDPENSSEVTVDGHMYNAWRNKVTRLNLPELKINNTRYQEVAHDFRASAFLVGLRSTEFQATLWLTWKRVNAILWNAQQSFEF